MKFDKTAQQRFTDLYKRYYKLMYHVAFEVLHNRVTTEDVVHTSCVRVLEHFSQVSAIDSPQTRNFVAIITKRIALTECSRMKREVPADVPTELENFDDLHETPVVAVERRDAQTALLMEIRRLGVEDQDILMLKYDNKFTVVQIAQALNMAYDIYALYIGVINASSDHDIDVLPQILPANSSTTIVGQATMGDWPQTEWTLYVEDVDGDTSASFDSFNPWTVSYVDIYWQGDSYVCDFTY